MYSFIRGKIAYIEENAVDLDVGGVGYHINTPTRTAEAAASLTELLLYTVLIVKEDEMSLYGFETRQEKSMFEKLISISGVGPKAAQNILSGMTVQDIATALLSQDAKAFSRVNGIGPKTAGRIILELKDRVDIADAIGSPTGGTVSAAAPAGAETPQTEAIEALMGLGYSKAEAVSAVNAVSALGDTAEELTLMALKRLAM